jgi:hypothetical protein
MPIRLRAQLLLQALLISTLPIRCIADIPTGNEILTLVDAQQPCTSQAGNPTPHCTSCAIGQRKSLKTAA